MNDEFRQGASFKPWGPLISPKYENEQITKADIVVASVVWALTLVNVIIALWQVAKQTKTSRSPLRSVYVWMIWLELIVSFVMGLECYLHLLKLIPPSFAFYFTILFWWCIQVQLLLQIIINRIRVIVPDRRRSRNIMVATAAFVTAINISVFFIWIPARLQISHRYHVINEYWDRTEKALYLFVDAALNWYFLKTVKANLISNGLTKYNKLVRFNQRIVAVSLLMDVMIIAAMSIPNSFVYIQFHPLAYLVKLNIEMTMANLIKRIAISTSRRTGMASIAQEFKSGSNLSSTGQKSSQAPKRGSLHELSTLVTYNAESKAGAAHERIISFAPTGNQIKTTQEVTVTSEPNPFFERGRRGSEVEITGAYNGRKANVPGIVVEESRSKSLDSNTEVAESLKSEGVKREGESDDEAALVEKKGRWGRGA
ncbi:hypothetical protein CC86DRAFT_392267 [Ophiobolus disseminans]|uniref:Integral membrane protein n=1 Tax=Ophiobolus disseminans TaxID=1469910 RepID=A0A6A7A6X6_9PLEO|nr:hypothetical protein CC86DRAFT_392267 [Ophiobolus disseminans]